MPLLPEVLSDFHAETSTLHDFTAYLSRHHCLETLQFIQDASRYQAYYADIVKETEIPWEHLRRHCNYLQELWEDLLGSYILPHGHREVNPPSEIRTRLLRLHSSALPPHPSGLDDVIRVVLELMEDSILPEFLEFFTSLDQPGGRGTGGWRVVLGRLQRKVSTSTSERDYEDSVPWASRSREDGDATHCTRRGLLAVTLASPRSHLLRHLGGLFDHTVCSVRNMRWLKSPPEKDRAEDTEIDTQDKWASAMFLE
jgi:hypothetical protein